MSIFTDEAAAKAAFEDLRNDTSPTNWVLVGYVENNTEQVSVLQKAEGGFADLEKHLKDDEVAYAVLGLHVIDEGVEHLKHIFITWVGSEVKPLHKARSSQHRLPIYNFAKIYLQLAGEYQALTREELTEDLLKQKLAGTKVASEHASEATTVLKSKGAATSEKFQFDNEEAAKTAIQGIRSDTEIKWALFGYPADREDIVTLVKTGTGGVDSWKDLLQDNEVSYIISGVNLDAGDYANQIKFIEITWVGPETKPLHKARSSQHRLQIYRFAKELVQLAGEAQFLNRAELSQNALSEKLLGATTIGAKSEEELRAAAAADAAKKQHAPTTPTKSPEEFKTPLSDEAGVKTLVEGLGKPGNETNWITFGYDKEGSKKDPQVVFNAKGNGGVEEVLPLLEDDEVLYILMGHIAADAAAEYSTLKFIFITWVGPKVKPLHKARSSQHRVALYNFIDRIVNLAGELQLLNKDELTTTLLSQKLTGSKLAGNEDSKAASSAQRSRTPPPTRNKEQLSIADEAAAKAALADVHNANTATNWVVFAPTGKPDTLGVSATGSGGVEELKAQLKEDGISFAVLSVTVTDEGSGEDYKTVKNIFISWVGPEVKPLLKARSSQLRLGLYNYIKAVLTLHGELQALTIADITAELVHQKLSGSKA